MLERLQALDVGLILLDLRLLLLELGQVTLVRRRARRHLAQVQADARLVRRDGSQLPLRFLDLARGLADGVAQLDGLGQAGLDALRGDRLREEPANAVVAL